MCRAVLQGGEGVQPHGLQISNRPFEMGRRAAPGPAEWHRGTGMQRAADAHYNPGKKGRCMLVINQGRHTRKEGLALS